MGVGLEVPSCVAQRSGPAGGQPCPPHIPFLASGAASTCWPAFSPKNLMPVSALCSTFSESCGHPSVLRPPLLPSAVCLVLGELRNALEESHPNPPPHLQTCLRLHAQSANCTDLAWLNLQHLEIKLAFLSKMNLQTVTLFFLASQARSL